MALDLTIPFALWLLPAPAWADRLKYTIAELAQHHRAHSFEPHLTICSGHGSADGGDRARAVEGLARSWSPIALRVDGLECGPDYFTFLFLRLQQAPGLDLIGQALLALPGCHGPAVGLHLSLLYTDPTPGAPGSAIDRGALALELESQLVQQGRDRGISFDRLALVQPGPGGWRHGWPWTIEATFSLVGEPDCNRL